jgi:hypothetical protein
LLTPGASGDLDSLLFFFAPKGGGLAKIQQLVQKAGASQTPLLQDQNWWQEIFSVFNIQDKSVQQDIVNKVSQSAGIAQQQGAQQQGGDYAALAAEFKNLLATQQANLERLKALKARLTNLGKAEEVLRPVALGLVSEMALNRSHLRFSGNGRKLGCVSTTSVHETDWFKDFMAKMPVKEGFRDFFDNLRTMVANPGHLQTKMANHTNGSTNERIAKLAVRHLSDYLTQELTSRLKVANLTVGDLAHGAKRWKLVQKAYAEKRINANTYQHEWEDVQRIIFALNPGLANGSP